MTTSGSQPSKVGGGPQAAVEIRRFVNDEIYRRAAALAEEDRLQQFVCECGDLTCTGVAEMSLAAYRLTEPGSVIAHR
jgi:hypothetical protein